MSSYVPYESFVQNSFTKPLMIHDPKSVQQICEMQAHDILLTGQKINSASKIPSCIYQQIS